MLQSVSFLFSLVLIQNLLQSLFRSRKIISSSRESSNHLLTIARIG